MRKKQAGFGLIGILITLIIIAFLVWGGFSLNQKQKQNQAQSGQEAIQKAQDAADAQNSRTDTLLENLNINPGY